MKVNENHVKRIAVIVLVALLAVMVFFLLRPILLTIIGGLLLAYALIPVYEKVLKRVKNKNFAAAIILVIVLSILLIPFIYALPMIAQQVFETFKFLQTFDIASSIRSFFPVASEQFVIQTTTALNSIISKLASSIMNGLLNFFLELPSLALHVLILAFVFFFSLRDKDKLKEFVSGLSPLTKEKEEIFVKQFKDITDSIIYGQVIIGIAQGLAAGIGLWIFGVSNVFLLTSLAIIFSIIPMIGPAIVWVPVAIYLFANSSPIIVITFLLYNLLIVASIDNLLRIYIVSKKTPHLSAVIVLIGMIGGLFIFGILGLIIGPLILAYFITFLKAYKEKKWQSLFTD